MLCQTTKMSPPMRGRWILGSGVARVSSTTVKRRCTWNAYKGRRLLTVVLGGSLKYNGKYPSYLNLCSNTTAVPCRTPNAVKGQHQNTVISEGLVKYDAILVSYFVQISELRKIILQRWSILKIFPFPLCNFHDRKHKNRWQYNLSAIFVTYILYVFLYTYLSFMNNYRIIQSEIAFIIVSINP